MDKTTPQKSFDITEPEVKKDTSPIGQIPTGLTLEHQAAELQQLSLIELLSQWKQFGTSTVRSNQATGAHLRTFELDNQFYAQHIGSYLTTSNVNPTSTAFNWFSGFRCDVEIKVEQVSMMQHQGASIVICTNIPRPVFDSNVLTNIFNFNKLPRTYFKFGLETTAIFKMPWASNLEFWPIEPIDNVDETNAQAVNGYNHNGVFQHRIHSPLLVAENVPDLVTYRYWIRLTNLKLRVYQPKLGLR